MDPGLRLIALAVVGVFVWFFHKWVGAPVLRWVGSSAWWAELRLPLALAVATGGVVFLAELDAVDQADTVAGATLLSLALVFLVRGAGRRYLFGSEHSQRRTRLRVSSAVLLIVVGSGFGAAGVVESQGDAAGVGAMLIVSGAFLLRWKWLIEQGR